MKNLKNLFRLSLLSLLVAAILSSCGKENTTVEPTVPKLTESQILAKALQTEHVTEFNEEENGQLQKEHYTIESIDEDEDGSIDIAAIYIPVDAKEELTAATLVIFFVAENVGEVDHNENVMDGFDSYIDKVTYSEETYNEILLAEEEAEQNGVEANYDDIKFKGTSSYVSHDGVEFMTDKYEEDEMIDRSEAEDRYNLYCALKCYIKKLSRWQKIKCGFAIGVCAVTKNWRCYRLLKRACWDYGKWKSCTRQC